MRRSSIDDLARGIKASGYLILDFDGTLVDSNAIKLKAFDHCFLEYSDHLDQILKYCYSNNHTSRWAKFKYVFEFILKKPYTPEVEKKLSDQYADSTTKAVISCHEIPGAEEFLQKAGKFAELCLVSSTPSVYLDEILTARNWKKYFKVIQGAPVVKEKWVKEHLRIKNKNPQDVIFFGDTQEDMKSAMVVGCPFVLVVNENNKADETYFLKDFNEINSKLQRL